MKSFTLSKKTILMISGLIVLFVVLFSLLAPSIEGFQSGSLPRNSPLPPYARDAAKSQQLDRGRFDRNRSRERLRPPVRPALRRPALQANMLGFAPVPDLTSRGYSATGFGDAFSQDITDEKALKLAGLTTNRILNLNNDPKFVGSCASSCDALNSGKNKYCGGFVLDFDSQNKLHPIRGCTLKKGKTGLSAAQDKIAYFLKDA